MASKTFGIKISGVPLPPSSPLLSPPPLPPPLLCPPPLLPPLDKNFWLQVPLNSNLNVVKTDLEIFTSITVL